jgi:UDPglucose 6-dehydrogenase
MAARAFPRTRWRWSRPRQDYEAPLRIVEAVRRSTTTRKRAMARKVAHALGGDLRGKTVAVLGLTFKPNTDDMRDSPSMPLVTGAAGHGRQGARATIRSAWNRPRDDPMSRFATIAYDCAQGADALVIVTEWEQFRALDLKRLKTIMVSPVLVDLRNIYSPEEIARHGFVYESVGRASLKVK